MNCRECEDEILRFNVLNNINASRTSLIECLHICFREKFIKWAEVTYFNTTEELLSDSFIDGIDAFANYVWQKGLKPDAQIETIVFEFCRRQLLKNLKANNRHPHILLRENIETDIADDDNNKDNYFECLHLSMKLLDNADLELITWKHYLKLSNEEITKRLNNKIEQSKNVAGRIENEINRCWNKVAGSYNAEMAGDLGGCVSTCLEKNFGPFSGISTHTATQRLYKAMERLRVLASDCIKKVL